MAIILDSKKIIKMNHENQKAETVSRFKGKELVLANMEAGISDARTVSMASPQWDGTEGYVNNMEKLKGALVKYNASQLPEDRTALYEPIYIDLARRILQQADVTGFVDTVITNASFSEFVGFKDFVDIDAIFDTIAGTGDAADLIELEMGDKTTVQITLNGVGWRDTLINALFNRDAGYIQKVLNAVARGYVAKKNDLAMNAIVTTTYDASMKVAADATGSTPEEKLYITLNSAVEKFNGLLDPLDGDEIEVMDLTLVVNTQDQRRVNRAINGVINQNADQVNRVALTEIENIVPYKQKTLRMGKKKVVYPGVAKNKAYLMVPKKHRYSLVKAGLTSLESQGSATTFSQDEKAWFFASGRYDDLSFGSSNAAVKAACAAKYDDSGEGYGYIIEVSLPA